VFGFQRDNAGVCNMGGPGGGVYLFGNTIFASGPLVSIAALLDSTVYVNISVSSNIFTAPNATSGSDNSGSPGIVRSLSPGLQGLTALGNTALIGSITSGAFTFIVSCFL
jgi:hypothetical protein